MVVKSKGNLLISGKSGLVKYYNLTRYKGYIGIIAGYTRYIGEYNYHLTQISGRLGDLLGMRYYPIIWGLFRIPRKTNQDFMESNKAFAHWLR